MRLSLRRDSKNGAKSPVKLLAWAIAIGFLFGLIGAGEYVEDRLRVVRNHINQHPASGDIVLVAIDEKSLHQVGRWPWPRGQYAKLVRAIDSAEPKMQLHDLMFADKSDPIQDAELGAAIADSREVLLAVGARTGAQQGTAENLQPVPVVRRTAQLASINFQYNYANEIWTLPRGSGRGTERIPSFASIMQKKMERLKTRSESTTVFHPKVFSQLVLRIFYLKASISAC